MSCYWPVHKTVMDAGVDGWWPDQGDGFDGPSRLQSASDVLGRHAAVSARTSGRSRCIATRRPGIQRFGGFIWSGDVQNRWETLKTHVAVGINTGLSGPAATGARTSAASIRRAEYTGELHVRWFQFGAFNPLVPRARPQLASEAAVGMERRRRRPVRSRQRGAPTRPSCNNPEVEPICSKYLELRSRLMPYLYTAVRDMHDTGLPIMRALWLHYPDDPAAVARGDEYLWGRDMLVAPVVEKGATSRRLYLPRGAWFDFWTERAAEGGGARSIAPSIWRRCRSTCAPAPCIPMGPVKQYTERADRRAHDARRLSRRRRDVVAL